MIQLVVGVLVQLMVELMTGTVKDNDTTSSRYISTTNGRTNDRDC